MHEYVIQEMSRRSGECVEMDVLGGRRCCRLRALVKICPVEGEMEVGRKEWPLRRFRRQSLR